MSRVFIVAAVIALSFLASFPARTAHAGFPTLSALDADKTDRVFRTLGAALAFRPLEGPSSYGKTWGLALGVAANMASASPLEPITGSSSGYIPGANFYFGLQAPLGVALEAGFIPKVTIASASVSNVGTGLRWTFTDLFKRPLPVDGAVRANVTRTNVAYNQSVSGANVEIAYASTITTFSLGVGKRFFLAEPYFNLGYATQSASLTGTGTTSIYSSSYSTSDKVEGGASSLLIEAGVQLRLFVLTITPEFFSMFGTHGYALKAGLKF